MDRQALAGRVAVITGSTRGLGLAIAEEYAGAGATVVVSSRSAEAVARTVERLAAAGQAVSGRACDVAEPEAVAALAAHAVTAHGGFDIWVNNAGLAGPYGPTFEVAPERFAAVLRTNVLGTYYGSMAALGQFLPQGRGKLINLLGRGDRSLVPYQNAYASSKAWIRAFTLTLAKENAASGVGIFAFSPGLVDTELLRRVEVVTGHEQRLAAYPTVLRMWARPPELPAARAVWLASSATDGRTGLELRLLRGPTLARGLLGEAWRRLTRARPAAQDLTIVPLPPARPGTPAGVGLPGGLGRGFAGGDGGDTPRA